MDLIFGTDTVIAVKEAEADASVQAELLANVSAKLAEAKAALVKLQEMENKASAMTEGREQAFVYKDEPLTPQTSNPHK